MIYYGLLKLIYKYATLLPVPTNGERDAPALIRDVTENPSEGLLRRVDIRRISALRKSGFAPRYLDT